MMCTGPASSTSAGHWVSHRTSKTIVEVVAWHPQSTGCASVVVTGDPSETTSGVSCARNSCHLPRLHQKKREARVNVCDWKIKWHSHAVTQKETALVKPVSAVADPLNTLRDSAYFEARQLHPGNCISWRVRVSTKSAAIQQLGLWENHQEPQNCPDHWGLRSRRRQSVGRIACLAKSGSHKGSLTGRVSSDSCETQPLGDYCHFCDSRRKPLGDHRFQAFQTAVSF